MRTLGNMLKKRGYNVHLLGYPSRKLTPSMAADYIWRTYFYKINPKKPIVIVTHSMGGLVMQHLLERYQPKGIHCLIMIAPPNHGVELVTKFKKSIFTRWVLYVVGALPTHQLGLQKKPLAPNIGHLYKCHLINGHTKKTLSGMLISGANDGIVSIKSTLIPKLVSITTLPYEHLVLIFRKKTAKTIVSCIKN